MKLDRRELIAMSQAYFEACNEQNLSQCMNTLSNDCLMWFPAAPFKYKGKEALEVHFKDVFKTFKDICFSHYRHIVDEQQQSIVTYFKVSLTPHEGGAVHMRNCNIFHAKNRLFREVIIYNSDVLDAGFHEGSE